MIKRVLVGIVLSVLTLSPAFAEIKHYVEFGQCAVWSEIDEFTDVATAHVIACNYNQIRISFVTRHQNPNYTGVPS